MDYVAIQADAQYLPLAAEVVQSVVTSPPYWGQRSYEVPASVWGGKRECKHVWQPSFEPGGRGHQTAFCQLCGAWRGQLGLEPTPELYVQHIVHVFQEVRRVLKQDGTVWLNLGDSYCSTAPGTMGDPIHQKDYFVGVSDRRAKASAKLRTRTPAGLKPKDLVGIPWRVAFALQADGWWLRSDIVWAKPNPMPESVKDRPTKAHEYIFLLGKSERYFYDSGAIAEQQSLSERARRLREYVQGHRPTYGLHRDDNTGFPNQSKDGCCRTALGKQKVALKGTRNARTIWTIPTTPFLGAHFATFPEALAERCIRAGSRPGDIILDPFGGSGTTARVAVRLRRRAVHIDLGYQEMARDTRLTQIQPVMFV